MSRAVAVVAAVALVVGLGAGAAAGYAAGDRHGARPSSSSSGGGNSAASAYTGGPALVQTGNLCSEQFGTSLQLGIQLSNNSSSAVSLGQIRAILPMGGLQMTGATWGPCGELDAGPRADNEAQGEASTDQYLAPGSTGWLTVVVKVLVKCPTALPVQYEVGYQQHGKLSTVYLPGFQDLGTVPYSSCPER